MGDAWFEASHAIVYRASCGKDQHRRAQTELTEPEDQTDSVQIRQAEVDYQHVRSTLMARLSAVLPSPATST
jgi:hypothetical protein